MALTYGFYNSVNHDRRYFTTQFSNIVNAMITDGVFLTRGNAFAVTPAANGLGVNVDTGFAWFTNTWTENDQLLGLTLTAADVSRPRIDAIVLDVNGNDDVRENDIIVVTGAPYSTPTKPTLINEGKHTQHALAYVTVNANATSILAENIEIVVGQNETPYADAKLSGIDITALFQQWQGEFETWFADVQSQLEGDVATNLLNKINALEQNKLDKVADRATAEDLTAGAQDKWVSAGMLREESLLNANGLCRVLKDTLSFDFQWDSGIQVYWGKYVLSNTNGMLELFDEDGKRLGMYNTNYTKSSFDSLSTPYLSSFKFSLYAMGYDANDYKKSCSMNAWFSFKRHNVQLLFWQKNPLKSLYSYSGQHTDFNGQGYEVTTQSSPLAFIVKTYMLKQEISSDRYTTPELAYTSTKVLNNSLGGVTSYRVKGRKILYNSTDKACVLDMLTGDTKVFYSNNNFDTIVTFEDGLYAISGHKLVFVDDEYDLCLENTYGLTSTHRCIGFFNHKVYFSVSLPSKNNSKLGVLIFDLTLQNVTREDYDVKYHGFVQDFALPSGTIMYDDEYDELIITNQGILDLSKKIFHYVPLIVSKYMVSVLNSGMTIDGMHIVDFKDVFSTKPYCFKVSQFSNNSGYTYQTVYDLFDIGVYI